MTKFGMHMRIDLGMVPTKKKLTPTQGAKIKKKNTKLDSKQTSNVPCQTIQSYVISTSFLSTDCELNINPCSKNVYNLGPRGVEVGVLGGSKNQKSGKCHELSRKSIIFVLTHVPGVLGVNISTKVREISRTPEKIDKKKLLPKKKILTTTQPIRRGGGGKGENFKVTKHQLLKSISGMQLSWAKPGNPREGGREGGRDE